MGYISSIAALAAMAFVAPVPSAAELASAIRVLSNAPVVGYSPFDTAEVQIIGQYRLALSSIGGYETVWPAVVNGLPEAWVYAVHEAAELQAFADMGANPFDAAEFGVYISEAHLRATLSELDFLKAWARQSNLEIPELAFEITNRERSQYRQGHATLLNDLQQRQGWSLPTTQEIQVAARFWSLLRTGKLP